MAEKTEDVKQKAKSVEEEKAKKKKRTTSQAKSQKKIHELEEKIKELEETNQQLRDQNLRKIAEFENYKRRTEKEFLAHLENANEGLITELLPVIDDFERFLKHAEEDQASASLREGVELIYKKMINILEKKGLKKMEAVGEEFDAEKHQALMQIDSDTHESGFIVDEHLPGYTLNDKVIRHSQVIVAK